jgi:sugar diacid utilization regulator
MTLTAIITAIGGVGTVVLGIITKFLIPLLEAKQGTEKIKQEAAKFESYVSMAKQAVAAAQQMATLATNEQMANYVKTFLKNAGVPDSMIEVVHEAAVLALKAANTAFTVLDTAEEEIMKAIGETRATDVADDETSTEAGEAAPADTTQTEDTAQAADSTVTATVQTADTGKTVTVTSEVYELLKSLNLTKGAV